MTDPEKVRRGLQAQGIIENEVYREAWASLERSKTEAWKNSTSITDRERLWFELNGLRSVKLELERLMAVGKEADKQIQRNARGRTDRKLT